ncbi:MAG: class II fumarate hydratase [Eubacteriales bacterium]|nr:class II fumarate hydratase [Eubacteriales bacterium]
MSEEFRIEHDTMGEVRVPRNRYWGAQTERSFENFKIGEARMPKEIIRAFAVLKKAAAEANRDLDLITPERADLIKAAADIVLSGKLDDNFPLVVYQTGSGTQSNMNMNEVLANVGNALYNAGWKKGMPLPEPLPSPLSGTEERILHPNDHVNRSQSSNDTFPTALHIAALLLTEDRVLPSAEKLRDCFKTLEKKYWDIPKTGRTHLQDAVPLTLGQEISGWRSMLDHDIHQIRVSSESLRELALGGTAVGTGLNAHPDFPALSASYITRLTGKEFVTAPNKFQALTSKDAVVFVHGALKALAADLLKIANDVRMLSSGPRCGIGELIIPANEPGSSIMPGKVNPTQCEAVTMAAVRVMGNDVTVGVAASQGNFQLNVFMPVIAHSFLESANLLADAMESFRVHCAEGIRPNYEKISENLERSLMLVTALNPHIGYEKSAKIAKKAHQEGLTLREAAVQTGFVSEEEFDAWVDPRKMTGAASDAEQ